MTQLPLPFPRETEVCRCHSHCDGEPLESHCPHKYENDEEPCHVTPFLDGRLECNSCAWVGSW